MNVAENVNSHVPRAELDRLLAMKLEDLLGSISWLTGWTVSSSSAGDSGWDVQADLPLPTGERAQLLVECKRELRPAQFALLASRPRGKSPTAAVTLPVLALPRVSPRLAELARQSGWGWYDLAGNCRLDVPGLLHIDRSGIPPAYPAPRTGANLGSSEAARVLRALLAPQHAGRIWTQRSLQAACRPSVSLGLVNKLIRHLRDEAFIEVRSAHGFRLRDPVGALAAWAAAYAFARHSRRGYFTLLQGRRLVDALTRLEREAEGCALYASFSAAEFQAPHVRQPRTWLYLATGAEAPLRALLDAKPVESGDNLVVLYPEDEGVFYLPDRAPNRLPATNPVQTYVDLLHSGGRGGEAAEALLEQRLRPAWSVGASR